MAGLPPIGCLPMQMTVGSIFPSFHFLQRVCVDQQNWDSQGYNQKLHDLTSTWQAQLDGAKVVDLDIYSPIMDMIEDPAKYGELYIYSLNNESSFFCLQFVELHIYTH